MGRKILPELRFSEFDNGWEEKRLGSVVKFKKGKGIPKRDLSTGGNPCILYGELYTTYRETINKVFSHTRVDIDGLILGKRGDILIPSSGEKALEMSLASALLLDDIALGGDINILRPNLKLIDSRFLSYQLNTARKIDLAKMAEGASVVHLYNSNLEKIIINIPSKKEQDKISEFLELVDKRIDLQEILINNTKRYKNAIMQNIFNQEIRFKDKNNDNYPEWQEVKLKKILKERKTYAEKDQGIPHASLTINGIKLKTDRYNRDFLVRTDNKKYKISQEGDICYNPANLKFGVITINNTGTVIFSPIYVTFETKSKTNRQYLSYYLMRWNFINKVRKYEEGTVYERMAVKPVDFLKYKINLPSLEEQTKIANFLYSLDFKIDKETEKLDSLKELKKGLVQKMFI